MPRVVFAQTAPAPASTTCTCYCTSPNGAVTTGPQQPEACSDSCKKGGEKQIMCGKTPTDTPENNTLCFTQKECESQADGKGRQAGRWLGQAPDCVASFGGQGYCTPITYADIDLSFKLGEVSKVSDLGDYVQRGYNLLLGIGTTIAIVMIMVGGLQYVIGAGMSEQVMKGKERIKKALIGLVLLMGAYVILNTVSPQLVRLELPATPMVKRVTLLDGSKDCKTLEDKGFKTGDAVAGKLGLNFCGATKPVLKDEKGTDVAAGSICQVMECPPSAGEGARCAGIGDKAVCVSCQAAVPNNSIGLKPDAGSCRQLKKDDVPKELAKDQTPTELNYCFFTTDSSAMLGAGAVVADVAVGAAAGTVVPGVGTVTGAAVGAGVAVSSALIAAGTCAELSIRCADIKACNDYMGQKAKNEWLVSGALMGTIDEAGDMTGEKLCTLDPCDIAKKKKIQPCQFVERTGVNDECWSAEEIEEEMEFEERRAEGFGAIP